MKKYSVVAAALFTELALLWIGKTQQDQANLLFKDSNIEFLLSVIPFVVFLSTANLFCLLIPWRIVSSIAVFIVGVVRFLPLAYFASCGSYLNGNILSIALDAETRALFSVVSSRVSVEFVVVGIFAVIILQLAIWSETTKKTANHGFIQCMHCFCLRCVGCQ